MNVCDLTPSEQLEVKGTLYEYCDAKIYDKLYEDFENSSTYVLPLKTYLKLKADSMFLQCLKNGGVDNWDGWDYAVDDYDEMIGEDN